MVVKLVSEPDEVFFLEALGDVGVTFRRWSRVRQAVGNFYTKIAIRHLDCERTDEKISLLAQFIEETEGSAYEFKLN